MSIIKSLQEWLGNFDELDFVDLSEIATDIVPENPSGYAIQLSGTEIADVSITGHRTYRNSYCFYARECCNAEYDRAENYDFIESLIDWIESKNESDNLPILPGRYAANEITVTNAMLFDIYDDGTGLYQITLQLLFERK